MVEIKDDSDPVSKAIDKLKPILSKLTFGSFVGYCSAYATKTAGKAAALAIGFGFIFFQGLVYAGYIDIDWGKVQSDAIKTVDTVSFVGDLSMSYRHCFSYVLSSLYSFSSSFRMAMVLTELVT